MNSAISLTRSLMERGLLPDSAIRWGIRQLLRRGLSTYDQDYPQDEWFEHMRQAPVALVPEAANAQHYEVPAAFYELVLGPHRKYSSCYYPEGVDDLGTAEAAMLERTCARADLQDGQDVLELGCGWGSLTLWMAEHYPASRITAVSNSSSQRRQIEGEARRRGLSNVQLVTCDMNAYDPQARFDRVVSVEMFEHMRNWEQLLGRIHGWLRPDGSLFLHVFAHRVWSYPFDVRDAGDWMSEHFFSGGMMPSAGIFSRLRIPFAVAEQEFLSGVHYQRTAEHWLENLDRRRAEVWPILRETYGAGNEWLWYRRWRVFFLACAELWGCAQGQEWGVLHTRLTPSASPPVSSGAQVAGEPQAVLA